MMTPREALVAGRIMKSAGYKVSDSSIMQMYEKGTPANRFFDSVISLPEYMPNASEAFMATAAWLLSRELG